MDKKVKQKATELLELVATELRARGNAVETNPEDLGEPGGLSREKWTIKIDGDRVPLMMDEKSTGSPYHRHGTGQLEVRCDWVWHWRENDVRMKSKTFGFSKTRPATHGYDVKVIAEHLLLWLKTDRLARSKTKQREDFEKQWKEVELKLKRRFPKLAGFIESDAKGIHIDLVLGERQALDVLEALDGPPRCRECHCELEPIEKPICEDCCGKLLADIGRSLATKA